MAQWISVYCLLVTETLTLAVFLFLSVGVSVDHPRVTVSLSRQGAKAWFRLDEERIRSDPPLSDSSLFSVSKKCHLRLPPILEEEILG